MCPDSVRHAQHCLGIERYEDAIRCIPVDDQRGVTHESDALLSGQLEVIEG